MREAVWNRYLTFVLRLVSRAVDRARFSTHYIERHLGSSGRRRTMPHVRPAYDRQKFEELILYVAKKSDGDQRYGAGKLAKLLYFIDFGAYGSLGESISGARYHLIARGPAPKALVPVREEMRQRGDIEIKRVPMGDGYKDQERVIALREPKGDAFTEEERYFIDSVIERFKDMNAAEMSYEAHKEVGVRLADEKEEIPYGTVYLRNEPWTEDEIESVRRHLKERGWARAA